MLKRITDAKLKENGFKKFRSSECYVNGGIIFSFGLLVAIGNKTAKGYHDFSTRTSAQITKVTGVDTATRRKKWDIMDVEDWEEYAEQWMDINMRI